jgi:glycosyltransferase involved in cell wall biosynthesis
VLDNVLVITVRKSFWASREAERFPNRIYTRILYGRSGNLTNSLLVFAHGMLAYARLRPRVIFVGSAHRIVPWLIAMRRLGLLRKTKLLVTNHIDFDDQQARHVDRIIVYSRGQIGLHDPALRDRYVFMPLPADGDFAAVERPDRTDAFVFSGGGGLRDFPALIEAVRGLDDVRLEIVTFSPQLLESDGSLPPNCEVQGRLPLPRFLGMAAAARFVAVPLKPGPAPHGQTTVVQAIRLGKALVATRDASLEDYVEDGKNGLLVDAGDVDGYRDAVRRMWNDDELRASCEREAAARAGELTYEAFAARIVALCEELVR